MLVALGEDAKVVDKRLKTEHHPLHPCWQQSWGWRWWWCWRPGRPRLEEPDQLVQIVAGDLLRLVKKENWVRNYSDLWSRGNSRARTCVGVPSHKCLQRSPILTRAHREVGVGVWPERKWFFFNNSYKALTLVQYYVTYYFATLGGKNQVSLVNRQHFCPFVCPTGPYLALFLVQKNWLVIFADSPQRWYPPCW